MGHVVRRRSLVLLLGSAICWATGLGAGRTTAADFDRQTAITERSTYGLPTDGATLVYLAAPGIDVGTSKWGFPLTADEDRRLDLNGRMYFADRASRSVIPFVRELPTYAGAYIDQLDEGSLVVLLTALDPAVVASIQAAAPEDHRKVRTIAAEYSATELLTGRNLLLAGWDEVPPDVPIITAGVDYQRNSLRLTVVAADVKAAAAKAASFADELGIPIDVREGRSSEDVVCTDRDHCHTPLRAGVRVRAGSGTSANLCTMGFHIVRSGDVQWLTAGHCGCAFVSSSWYHTGLADKIGDELATLVGSKIDIMRVQMADAQGSALIYGDGGEMTTPAYPIQGETIKASLGRTNAVVTGTVTDVSANWNSSYCSLPMEGGDSSITAQTGDSGSPLYRKWSFGGEWFFTPIGIVDTAVGQFGFVKDACAIWGATILGA